MSQEQATKVDIEYVKPTVPSRCRRFTLVEKRGFVEEARQLGNSMSSVARKYGLSPSQLFEWRRMMDEGGLAGLDAGEEVVPASQARQLKAKIPNLKGFWAKRPSRSRYSKKRWK